MKGMRRTMGAVGSWASVFAVACASFNPAFDDPEDTAGDSGHAATTVDGPTTGASSGPMSESAGATDGSAGTGPEGESGSGLPETSSGGPISCAEAPASPLLIKVSDKLSGDLPPKQGTCMGARGFQNVEFATVGDQIFVEECVQCPCMVSPITIDFQGTASLPDMAGCGEVVVFEDTGPDGSCIYGAVMIFGTNGADAPPDLLITGSLRSFYNGLASPTLGVDPDCDYAGTCPVGQPPGPYQLNFTGTRIAPGLDEQVDFGPNATYQVFNRESYIDDECTRHAGWQAIKL